MKIRVSSRLVVLVMGIGVARALAAGGARPRMLVQTGWDKPDQVRLKQSIGEIEKRPFNGVMINVIGQRENGKPRGIRGAHSAEAWQRSWFQTALSDLRSAKSGTVTENFVSIGANPGDVDWFDDTGWASIVENWAIAAWLARQGGLRGIHFDPEPYHKPYAQFRYGAQAEKDRHTFAEYAIKARERGRQVMAAVVREFPDITVFCYFMNSANRAAATAQNPQSVLVSSAYGLYPAFIDGWLDAADPRVVFVDGCESAYRFHSELQYLSAANAIKGDCQSLVSPGNRAKYRAQVQVSFGIYLDAYWNPADSKWSRWRIDCGDRKPVEKLLENVRHALDASDGYVWIYGEKFRWWPTANRRVFPETWPEALPHCDTALRVARDPLAYARFVLEDPQRRSALKNLVRNGDFQSETVTDNAGVQSDWVKGGAPAGWHSWQMKPGEGAFEWDRVMGAAKASGVSESGCFIQTFDAAPGETYAVRARVKLGGSSRAWIRVRWQTADGHWIHEGLDRMIAPGPRNANGWSILFGAVSVPTDVGKLVLLLGMGDQHGGADAVWFDDVELFRLTASDVFRAAPIPLHIEK